METNRLEGNGKKNMPKYISQIYENHSYNPMKLIQLSLDYPDYSIIRTFFSGPIFFHNIN